MDAEQQTAGEKHEARHQSHVKAGNGEKMRNPRIAHGHCGALGDPVPVPDQQRRCQGPGIARKLVSYPLRQCTAQCRQPPGQGDRPGRFKRQRRKRKSDGTDPLEIERTLEVVGVGRNRRRGRLETPENLDPRPGRRRPVTFQQEQSDTARPVRRGQPAKLLHTDDQPLPPRRAPDLFHHSGEDCRHLPLQYGGRNLQGPVLGSGESAGCRQGRYDDEDGHCRPADGQQKRDEESKQARPDPERRLCREVEITENSGAESHR